MRSASDMHGSTNPNKAFSEAVTLVGILLAVLLLSVLHIKGYLSRGKPDVADPLGTDALGEGGIGGDGKQVDRDGTAATTPVSGGTIDTPAGDRSGEGQEDANARDRNRDRKEPPGGARDGRDGKGDDDGGGGAGALGGEHDSSPPDQQTLRFPQGVGRFSNFPHLDDKHVEITMQQLPPGTGAPAQAGMPVGSGSIPHPVSPSRSGHLPHPGNQYGRKVGVPIPIRRGIPGSAAPARSTFDFLPWQQTGKSEREEGRMGPAVVSPIARVPIGQDVVSPIPEGVEEKSRSSVVRRLLEAPNAYQRLWSLYGCPIR